MPGKLRRLPLAIFSRPPSDPRCIRRQLVALRGDPAIPQIHPDANAITGCIIVGSDVTELVEAESALQKSAAAEHAAREASRLKTQFLTTITHEIRTPIAGILGICELLLGDSSRLSDDQRSLVQQAVRSADTLLELIGAVLDLRKVEENALALEMGPFLVEDALNDARLFSVIAQKKGLEFVEDVRPFYPGTLLGDRLRLRQILANALSNAVKFTKSGGWPQFAALLSAELTALVPDRLGHLGCQPAVRRRQACCHALRSPRHRDRHRRDGAPDTL